MLDQKTISTSAMQVKIKEELQASHIKVEDISGGCGQAFSCIIVSTMFENKSTLARHRMVNTALKDEITAIHAWSVKCYTPAQWNELKEKDTKLND